MVDIFDHLAAVNLPDERDSSASKEMNVHNVNMISFLGHPPSLQPLHAVGGQGSTNDEHGARRVTDHLLADTAQQQARQLAQTA